MRARSRRLLDGSVASHYFLACVVGITAPAFVGVPAAFSQRDVQTPLVHGFREGSGVFTNMGNDLENNFSRVHALYPQLYGSGSLTAGGGYIQDQASDLRSWLGGNVGNALV